MEADDILEPVHHTDTPSAVSVVPEGDIEHGDPSLEAVRDQQANNPLASFVPYFHTDDFSSIVSHPLWKAFHIPYANGFTILQMCADSGAARILLQAMLDGAFNTPQLQAISLHPVCLALKTQHSLTAYLLMCFETLIYTTDADRDIRTRQLEELGLQAAYRHIREALDAIPEIRVSMLLTLINATTASGNNTRFRPPQDNKTLLITTLLDTFDETQKQAYALELHQCALMAYSDPKLFKLFTARNLYSMAHHTETVEIPTFLAIPILHDQESIAHFQPHSDRFKLRSNLFDDIKAKKYLHVSTHLESQDEFRHRKRLNKFIAQFGITELPRVFPFVYFMAGGPKVSTLKLNLLNLTEAEIDALSAIGFNPMDDILRHTITLEQSDTFQAVSEKFNLRPERIFERALELDKEVWATLALSHLTKTRKEKALENFISISLRNMTYPTQQKCFSILYKNNIVRIINGVTEHDETDHIETLSTLNVFLLNEIYSILSEYANEKIDQNWDRALAHFVCLNKAIRFGILKHTDDFGSEHAQRIKTILTNIEVIDHFGYTFRHAQRESIVISNTVARLILHPFESLIRYPLQYFINPALAERIAMLTANPALAIATIILVVKLIWKEDSGESFDASSSSEDSGSSFGLYLLYGLLDMLCCCVLPFYACARIRFSMPPNPSNRKLEHFPALQQLLSKHGFTFPPNTSIQTLKTTFANQLTQLETRNLARPSSVNIELIPDRSATTSRPYYLGKTQALLFMRSNTTLVEAYSNDSEEISEDLSEGSLEEMPYGDDDTALRQSPVLFQPLNSSGP